MLFTTVAALLFPVAIMAAPPLARPASGDEHCLPTTYILSEYTSERSMSQNYVSFNLESTWTVDSSRVDPVEDGINCEADGTVIGDNNECNIRGEKTRKVVFDSYQREDSNIPSYRITHTWQCNNATWVSINDVEFPAKGMTCRPGKESDSTACNAKPVVMSPQNAQKLSGDNSKKVKVDSKPAVKPTTKPTI